MLIQRMRCWIVGWLGEKLDDILEGTFQRNMFARYASSTEETLPRPVVPNKKIAAYTGCWWARQLTQAGMFSGFEWPITVKIGSGPETQINQETKCQKFVNILQQRIVADLDMEGYCHLEWKYRPDVIIYGALEASGIDTHEVELPALGITMDIDPDKAEVHYLNNCSREVIWTREAV